GYSVARLAPLDGCRLEYDDFAGQGSRLKLRFPTSQEGAVRARVVARLKRQGWPIWRIQTDGREPIWEDDAAPSAYRAPSALERCHRELANALRRFARLRSLGVTGQMLADERAKARVKLDEVHSLGWDPETQPLPSDCLPTLEELEGERR